MIDIIVPVYNVEKYIIKCIESVQQQTYDDWHLILVDDGSTDNSGAICDRFAEKDAKITIIHRANGGTASARNTGLSCLKGDCVLFLDSDDSLKDGALACLVDAMQKSNADMVCGGYDNINENGEFCGRTSFKTQLLTGESRFTILYEQPCLVMVCGKLYRRKVLDGFRFREGTLHEDVFAYHELAYNADSICITDQLVFNYLTRNGNKSSATYTIKHFDAFEALFERMLFYEEKGFNISLEMTVKFIYFILICYCSRIDFQNTDMVVKLKNCYDKWKDVSGLTYGFAFRMMCFVNSHKFLKRIAERCHFNTIVQFYLIARVQSHDLPSFLRRLARPIKKRLGRPRHAAR